MLLDVSSRADQMGVTLGPAIAVERDERGDVALRSTAPALFGVAAGNSGMPLQIMNMDVVTTARHVRAATLPQISWEPVWNIPLPIEGPRRPGRHHHRDPRPRRVRQRRHSDPHLLGEPVPGPDRAAAGDPARHQGVQRPPHTAPGASVFTLPFGLVAQADFTRLATNPAAKNAQLDLNMPHFDQLRGGLQIKALPAGVDQAGQVQRLVQGLDVPARQHPLGDSRAAPVRLDARQDRAGRLQPEVPADASTRPAPTRWSRSSAWSSRDTARRSSATTSTRPRPSPTSARCSSTSSSAGRGTRWCRSAASSIRSASTSSGRSR